MVKTLSCESTKMRLLILQLPLLYQIHSIYKSIAVAGFSLSVGLPSQSCPCVCSCLLSPTWLCCQQWTWAGLCMAWSSCC